MISGKVCCFTGHRDFEVTATPREKMIFEALLDNLIQVGYTIFKAGGALGFDTYAAQSILRRREAGAPIRLELVLPCEDQSTLWSQGHKDVYDYILRHADAVDCLYPTYTGGCMHERNRKMVDESSACVAFCRHKQGGTYYTLQYAVRQKITIYNICRLAQTHIFDNQLPPT